MPETPRVIGEFDAYPGMIAALRARIASSTSRALR
jgi:hypothetical protein